jgi:hypothetical protein
VTPSSAPGDIPWYHADTRWDLVGSHTGDLSNTYTADATAFVIMETAATPAFEYHFQFGRDTDVPSTAISLHLVGNYNGEDEHTIKLGQWNYTTSEWTNVTADVDDFPRAETEQVYRFPLIDNANYLSGGTIKIRFVHGASANIEDVFRINQMYLALVASPSATPSTTPSQTPSHTQSATPSATVSATSSATPSATPSATVSQTPSTTISATPSATGSATPSATPSPSGTASATPSATPSATGIAPGGQWRTWTGTVWNPCVPHTWTGTSWEEITTQYWTGIAWNE